MTTAPRLAVLFCLSLGLTAQTAQGDHTVSYTYTAQGQVATVDGPRLDVSDITTYDYDAQGRRISIANPLGHITQITAHDGADRPLTMISPSGLTTTLSYDARGRMIQQTRGDGATSRTTQYAYDPAGNLTQVTQPDGSFLRYAYDPAHRLIGIQDNQGNRIDYTLDAMGNRLSEQLSDPQGTLMRSQSQVYDQLGQLSQQRDSQNHTTAYGYDANGNLTQSTDANQQATAQSYDPHDRLRQVTDPLNGATHYTYDAQHNLTRVTDPNGLSTTYAYDGLGNLVSQTSPDTGATSYTVDEAGNRLTQTDARGVTVSYTYDALNRLTAIHYPDSSLDVSYTYDQGANGIGQLTQMSDAQGITDYSYNAYGELISQTRTSLDGIVTTVSYAYDAHGRLTTLTYPSGKQLHYGYATDGQLTTLTLEQTNGATQSLVSNLQRLPFGPIQALDYGNGLSLSRTFDQDYRLIAQSLPGVLDSSYAYDPVGNLSDWLDPTHNQTFGYDERDRLSSASGAYGDLGYSYDATGNRLSLTEDGATETYSYAPDSHRLLQILGALSDTRGYDAAGNTTQSRQGSFDYDDSNRLIRYTNADTLAEYAYNGKGERIQKTVNGLITRFRYSPEGQLLGEYDNAANPLREYVYLDGQPIALLQDNPHSPANLLQSIRVNHTPKTVDLGGHLVPPVVIAGPPTYNGGQAAVVALSGLSESQARVSVQEWDYLDGGHAQEAIALLALPPGRYPQADGSVWEIGRFTLSGTRQMHSIAFSEAFETIPYLFLTQQSQNDPETTVVRARNLSATGFQAALFEQESLQDGHGQETIGYLAIHSPGQSGTANFYGTALNYQLSQLSLNQNWASQGDQQLWLQEEQSADSETGHMLETVDILRLEGHLFAQDVSTFGWDTAALRRQGTTPSEVLSGTPEAGTLAYLHTDHLGAVVKATDGNQAIIWDAQRRPFGERTVTTARIAMPLGFPGQYFDQESNNYYNYFLDYDPTTGRYLQSDPIGLEGGLNTYVYVGLNPLNIIDIYGLSGALAFNPDLNSNAAYIQSNNCYSYAINRGGNPGHPLFGGGWITAW
ncbi:MAG: hypothetical protein KZQ99_13920 [Candidatus Thiodiazotropha sp. (ex Dulcina madagascariensis)]|nr:hypothetical protein [Candidatus Thiodiazotropha sp. (ex Dulcina madagascariensis)]